MNAQQSIFSSEKVLIKLKAELFSRRGPAGYWRGRLSGSALSTAVGLFALAMVDSDKYVDVIRCGLLWLRDNVNEDGGWGDTVVSKSNLSTTLLVWAAWGVMEEFNNEFIDTIKGAESFIENSVGGLEPEQIVAALIKCYGKDKTFAVPILSMLTMAGCLGPLPQALHSVSQLPFELAVLPQSCFRWLRLPVVSYALPALIAIGVWRHIMASSRNPVSRFIRNMVLARALKVLEKIQPDNGGFLEATPLTGFVVMNLAAAGYKDCQVVRRGVEFLAGSARADGCWPIDTDLAIWVTTLAVNAVDAKNDFTDDECDDIKEWLLDQQFKIAHPFTGAAPGGWGWTDLPGSVPDADDTAGALLALRVLSATDDVEVKHAAEAGLSWLLCVQNSDGGVPTFCKGWGLLPFDMSSPDITAHAIDAISAWEDCMNEKIQRRLEHAKTRMLRYLKKRQLKNGSWLPLWFGNEDAAKDTNPVYGTARVLVGIKNSRKKAEVTQNFAGERMILAGYKFLCNVQNHDGGWGGDADVASSVEETSLAVIALSGFDNEDCNCAVKRGMKWLIENIEDPDRIKATPIGLYFASLWYYESMYPLIFAIAALK